MSTQQLITTLDWFDDASLDPTRGRQIAPNPDDDPTQGRRLGSRPGDDPTRAR